MTIITKIIIYLLLYLFVPSTLFLSRISNYKFSCIIFLKRLIEVALQFHSSSSYQDELQKITPLFMHFNISVPINLSMRNILILSENLN